MDKTKLTLKFDFNAILTLEAEGFNVFAEESRQLLKSKPSAYEVFVWAGLLYDKPDLKRESVKTLLRGVAFGEVVEEVTRALQEALSRGE